MKITGIPFLITLAVFGMVGMGKAQNTELNEFQQSQLIQCIDIENKYHKSAHAIIASSIDNVENYRHVNTQLKILSDDYHMVLMSFENENAFGNMARNVMLARSSNKSCEIDEMDISKRVNFTPPDEFYDGFFDASELISQE